MATDLEQLQVTLSAKADQFKQEMQSAVREFDRDANQIEQRNQQLSQSMNTSMQSASSSVRFLSGALKSLFSVYAIQQFVSAIKDANTQLAQMGDTAKRLQLSTDQFQRLGYAGKTLGGLDQGEVGAGALALQQKANKEVREGEGELTRLLEANNMKLTDRSGKVKDINALLEMAFKLIQNAGSEADKIDIAHLFALTEKWVGAAEKGPVAFKNAQEEAGKVGAIIDKSIIEKAKQFDEAWNQSWSNFATRAKSAGVEAAGAVRQAWEAARDRAGFDADPKVLAQIAQQHEQAGGDPALATYFRQRSDAQARRVLAQRMTPEGQQFGPDYPGDFGPRQTIPGTGSGAAGGATLPGQVFGKTTGTRTTVPKKPETGGDGLDEYDREYNRIEKQIVAMRGQAAAIREVGEQAAYTEAKVRLKEAADEAGLKTTPALTMEIEKQARAYAQLKNDLTTARLEKDVEFERSQIGRTPDEQAIASRLRGLDQADEKTKKLADSMRNNQNLIEGKEIAGSFVKGLISDLESGVRAGQALENQLKRIADKLADKAIDSLISGLFGGLGKGLFSSFGVPSQAGGGWAGQGPLVNVPASAFIGAKHFAAGGGIPAILHAGEIVLNQAQQKNVAQGLGPSKPISITHAPTINGAGMTPEQVFGLVTRSQKEFARNILPIFNNAQRRFG